MKTQKNQNMNSKTKKTNPGHKSLFRMLFGFMAVGLLFAVSPAADSQNTDDLMTYFKEQAVPVESIRSEDGTVIAEIQLTESDDLSPQKMERNNVAVFSKLAESFPDSSVIRVEYSMEGEVFNILEIDTKDASAYSGQGPAGTAMLAHARMNITPSMRERISSDFDTIQARDEASELSAELSLPERTVDLPDETGFSGGGGGMAFRSPGSSATVILLFVLLAGCLALVVGILAVRSLSRAPSLKIQANLRVYCSEGGTKVFPVAKQKTTIGRGPSNDLILNDAQVSTRHAEIAVSEQTFLLRDLQSSNGTWLNGRRISESPLYVGDNILLGSTRLIFSE